MTALSVLIPLSILFVAGAVVALFWAVDEGQFDDMDTPGFVPLTDAPVQPHEDPGARS